METIAVALIVSVVAPLLLNWNHRRELRLDREERQEVAKTVAEAAVLLVDANERVAASTEITNGKLESLTADVAVVHDLVNSDKTAAMQRELDANLLLLVATKQVMAMSKAVGREPDPTDQEAIDAAQVRVDDLRTELVGRLRKAPISYSYPEEAS